jgi:hypothetical protein
MCSPAPSSWYPGDTRCAFHSEGSSKFCRKNCRAKNFNFYSYYGNFFCFDDNLWKDQAFDRALYSGYSIIWLIWISQEKKNGQIIFCCYNGSDFLSDVQIIFIPIHHKCEKKPKNENFLKLNEIANLPRVCPEWDRNCFAKVVKLKCIKIIFTAFKCKNTAILILKIKQPRQY